MKTKQLFKPVAALISCAALQVLVPSTAQAKDWYFSLETESGLLEGTLSATLGGDNKTLNVQGISGLELAGSPIAINLPYVVSATRLFGLANTSPKLTLDNSLVDVFFCNENPIYSCGDGFGLGHSPVLSTPAGLLSSWGIEAFGNVGGYPRTLSISQLTVSDSFPSPSPVPEAPELLATALGLALVLTRRRQSN